MRSLWRELRRRRVFRVAGAYVVVGWITIQIASEVAPALLLPEWFTRAVVLLVLLGLPIALVLSWAFDLTPAGVERTGEAPGEAQDDAPRDRVRASTPEPAPTRPRTLAPAAYVGLGIVLAVVLLGAYATIVPGGGGDRDHADRSIAVLPFANLSPDAENAFFAAGVHEDVLTQLALIGDLTVISRTSVLPYAETRLGVPQIARELGAAYVLEGSVRRAGDRVRVVAQLIDAAADEHVWAQQYDRDLTDLFAVQSEIAREIAGALEVALSPEEVQRVEGRPTQDVAAYELYLRAREIQGSRDGMNAAIELLGQAVAMDPGFSDAHAELAQAYVMDVQNFGRPVVWHDSAEVLARRAIDLAPDRSRGHAVLGLLLEQDGRYTEAGRHLAAALEINPGDADARRSLAFLERARGNHDLALEHLGRLRRLSPNNANALWNTAVTWHFLGDPGRARRWLAASDSAAGGVSSWSRLLSASIAVGAAEGGAAATALREGRVLVRDYPDDVTVGIGATGLLVAGGAVLEALPLAESLYREAPQARYFGRVGSIRGLLGALRIAAGETDRGRGMVEREIGALQAEIAAGSESGYLRRQLAHLHAALGQNAEALRWFEAALEAGERNLHPLDDPNGAAAMASAPDVYEHPDFRALVDRAEAELAAMHTRAIAAEREW